MAPFVHLLVEGERPAAPRVGGDDDTGAAFGQFGDDPVAIERLVGDQRAELDAIDQRGDADRVVALARQEVEADQIAQRVGERQDLGGPTALGLAYGLALSPPFEP